MRAGELNHYQFQEFLKSVDANYDYIICLRKKLLSGPNVEKILLFVVCCQVIYGWHQKQNFVPELDENWLTDFSFLMDSTTHFSELKIYL